MLRGLELQSFVMTGVVCSTRENEFFVRCVVIAPLIFCKRVKVVNSTSCAFKYLLYNCSSLIYFLYIAVLAATHVGIYRGM
jgi:hypothetical protein